MHRIYIASTWENRFKLRPVRDELIKRGHIVTSTWLDVEDEDIPAPLAAERDVQDLLRADILLFWPNDNVQKSSGKYFEYGFSFALGYPIVMVDPADSICIFSKLESWNILHAIDFEEAYNILATIEEV